MTTIQLHKAIAQARGHILRCERAVDDARHRLNQSVADLQDAVRERDRALVHIQHLIEMADDQEAA